MSDAFRTEILDDQHVRITRLIDGPQELVWRAHHEPRSPRACHSRSTSFTRRGSTSAKNQIRSSTSVHSSTPQAKIRTTKGPPSSMRRSVAGEPASRLTRLLRRSVDESQPAQRAGNKADA